MSEGIGNKSAGKIIEEFQETLPIFCETVLFNGHRNSDEWVVSNLDNDRSAGEGSCYVNLRTGCYYDFNPAADNQKGGPLDLWKSLFGVDETHEALAGIQKWVATGALPNGIGISADPRARRLAKMKEEGGDALLEASDDLEKMWLHDILVYRQFIAHCDLLAEKGWKDRPGETTYWGHKKVTEIDWREVARQKHRDHGEAIRALKSLFHTHRWQKVVANSVANKADIAVLLADYRGLSPGIFEGLIEGGYLALIKTERVGKEQLQIAFPVCREAEMDFKPTKRAFKPHPNPNILVEYAPERRSEKWIEFLGMHLRWFKGEFGLGGAWAYYPKGLQIEPLIIGDLKQATAIILAESQWDLIAFADLYELHRARFPWAGIATRGSANARLPIEKLPSEATLLAILQNDKANRIWRQRIPLEISPSIREIIPPAGIKDLNNWMRVASASEIRIALEEQGKNG
jgi:hypothetical protein